MARRAPADRLPSQIFANVKLAHAIVSPADEYLASIGADPKTLELRRMISSQQVCCRFTSDADIEGLLFSPRWPNRGGILTISENLVQLWDIGLSHPVRTYRHEAKVRQASFNKDGSKFITADAADTVYLWTVSNGECSRYAPGGKLQQVSFSPRGDLILVVSDKTVLLLDLSFRSIACFLHQEQVLRANFNPDATAIVSVCADQTVLVCPIQAKSRKGPILSSTETLFAQMWPSVQQIPVQPPIPVKFPVDLPHYKISDISEIIRSGTANDDSYRILTTTGENAAVLWSIPRLRVIPYARTNQWKYCGKFTHQGEASPIICDRDDGPLVITALDRQVEIWDPISGDLLACLDNGSKVSEILSSNDRRYLLTKSDDGPVMLWQVMLRGLDVCIHKKKAVSDAAFSPDGSRLLVACEDGTATISAVDTGKFITTILPWDGQLHGGISRALWCSKNIVLAYRDGTVFVWGDDNSYPHIQRLNPDGEIYDIDIDAEGKYVLIAGAAERVRVVDTYSGQVTSTLFHGSKVWKAQFTSNGQAALTIGADGEAKLWEITSGDNQSPKRSFSEVRGFDAQNHRILAVGKNKKLELQDAFLPEKLISKLDFPGVDQVQRVAFSGDGSLVLTSGIDNAVRLWSSSSGKMLAAFPSDSSVTSLGFNHGDKLILIGSADKVELYDVDTPKQIALSLANSQTSWWETVFFGQPHNLLEKDLPLLAKIITGASLSEDGTTEQIEEQDRIDNAMKLSDGAKSDVLIDRFLRWLFCSDERVTIFPRSNVRPTEWEKNATQESQIPQAQDKPGDRERHSSLSNE
jgi:WD40 repeat protein